MSAFGNAQDEMCDTCWSRHGSNPWGCFCTCHLPHLDKMMQLYKIQLYGGRSAMRTTRFWAACADTIPEGCDHRTFHGGPDGLKLAKEASVRSFRGFWEGQLSTNRYWDTHVVEWIEERQAPGKSGVLPVYRMYSLRYNRPIDDFIYHEQIRKEPRISKLAPTEYYVETLEMEE